MVLVMSDLKQREYVWDLIPHLCSICLKGVGCLEGEVEIGMCLTVMFANRNDSGNDKENHETIIQCKP